MPKGTSDAFGRSVSVPGRVNLIGEHIDYHALDVLPMALERRIRVRFQPRGDHAIHAVSHNGYGEREFVWTGALQPVAAGDWENYVRAAAATVAARWGLGRGIDAQVDSDLPAAAGLSSSSALYAGFVLALLEANQIRPGFEELMAVLPEGEQFVGTRGGGMDHAAVLGARPGCALRVSFNPASVRAIELPRDWAFLVAHSLTTAHKSGGAREEYNARRRAGHTALERLGLSSYRDATEEAAARLDSAIERDSFQHVTSEARRVSRAIECIERGDAGGFGGILNESHASLRDRLKVSCPALDLLVHEARRAGALGARLTGAGFGGCAVVLCRRDERPGVRAGLLRSFYAGRADFDESQHLIDAEPGAGALASLAPLE
jgi:galactokinase